MRLTSILLLGLLVPLPGGATAGFTLESMQHKDGGSAIRVHFQPSDRIPPPGGDRVLPPVGDESAEFRMMAAGRSAPPKPGESFLFALRGKAVSWRVTAAAPGSGAGGGELASQVRVLPVEVGTFHALQVIVDSDAIPAPARSLVLELDVQEEATPGIPKASQSASPLAAHLAADLFINAAEIDEIPLATTKADAITTEVLPRPPGAFRAQYTRGDELLRVPLASFAATTSDTATMGIVHHGSVLPLGGVDGGDAWFYAPRAHTTADLSDSVFLDAAATTASLTMATRPAYDTLTSAGIEVPQWRARRFPMHLAYDRASILPPGERFVLGRTQTGQTRTTSIEVADVLTTTTITVTAELLGFNVGAPDPDHYGIVTIQGVPGPTQQWKGRSANTTVYSTAMASLPNPPTLTVQHSVPTGSPFDGGTSIDIQELAAVTLFWYGLPRITSAGMTAVELDADVAPHLVTIGGFPAGTPAADIVVLDISNPHSPVRLVSPSVFPDTTGGVAVEFEVPAAGGTYFAQRLSAAPTVAAAPSETAGTYPAGSLAGIYVRDPSLAAALAPLLATRPKTIEVEPQAVYNAFGGGQQAPETLATGIGWILDHAPQRDPFPALVLVGHGSLDRHNYLGLQSGAQIPPFVEESAPTGGVTIESPVDYPYGTVEGFDDFIDVQLSRIPVKNATELSSFVAKQLAFDAQAETLRGQQRLGTIVTDLDPDFIADTSYWLSLWAGTNRPSTSIQVDGDANGTTETTLIRNALEAPDGGTAFMLYTGHGNTDRWSSENIFNNTSAPTMATAGKWPNIATFTCLNGYYAFPGAGSPCLAEKCVVGTANGAISFIAPCSLDLYFSERLFEEQVLLLLSDTYARPLTMGELLLRARNSFAQLYPTIPVTLHENLHFGDPFTSLTLDPPEPNGIHDWQALNPP